MASVQQRPDTQVLERKARQRLSRKLAATRSALFAERLIPLLWPPLAVLMTATGFGASGLLDRLPDWLHMVLLLSAAALVFVLVARVFFRFRPPSRDEAIHRLEAGELLHRPLTAMNDRLALGGGDAGIEALWVAHRHRMAARIERLRAPAPEPGMPGRDPMAFRFAAILVLVLGISFGSGDLGGNLLAAVTPSFDTGDDEPVTLEAWITPPAYTGRPPVFLAVNAAEAKPTALKVPVNSRLLARFHGSGDMAMHLGEAQTPFQRITERDQQLETPITLSGAMQVLRDGEAMGAWEIELIPDTAPTVAVTEQPGETLRGALRIAYHATDDYGLTLVAARISRVGSDEPETRLELPLPGRRQTSITDVVFRDLTDHRWAGLEVDLMLEVRDEAGQSGESEPVRLTLPEREFSQPAARAVVEQRRKLIADATGNRAWVVRAIEALQINPGTYNDDLAAHLMLSLSRAELRDSGAPDVIARNEELLWRTALRIEEGHLSVALNKLRQVQEKLMEALANGASEEEIQQLMDELQQAMNEYLKAMQQQAMERMQNGEQMQQSEQGQQIEQRALSDLIDRARELSRSGARDKAREMLSQLQNMLENLQMGTQSQAAQAEQQADQMLDELGRMMQQQQQLMDETYKRQQQQQRPQAQRPSQRDPFSSPRRNRFGRSPNTDTQNPSRGGQPGETTDEDLASAQERLRRQLNEMLQQLGESGAGIPDELGQAEQAMRDAEGALGDGDRRGALGSQAEALDRLRRGAESVLEDMANRNQNPGQNNEGSSQAGMDGEDTDPLGRSPTETWGDASEDLVPGAGALQRSREILDELRKRSGQRHRDTLELDYIERLLKRF